MAAIDLPSFFKSSSFFIDFQDRFIYWILVGLVAGWLAGKIARGRGFGCIADIVLGLVGSFLGGFVFAKLGIFGNGFLYSLAAATLGAVILVSIAHLFSAAATRFEFCNSGDTVDQQLKIVARGKLVISTGGTVVSPSRSGEISPRLQNRA
jgi:uncharacterized membrane protein YeaQ/YmgE (transglycosylase-associated protein family)